MSINREDLTPEWIARISAEMEATGNYRPLTEEQREQDLQQMLADVPEGEDVWLFGYGSLMWNPMVYHAEKRAGLLHGYHRRFCFWTQMGRGSPELPGLMLALDRGGSCRGMAFRIRAEESEAELRLLWMREMVSGVYQPRWVTVRCGNEKIRAITFVVNRDHTLYVGELPPETVASHLAHAAGWIGSSREYLENTIRHLEDLGFCDNYLNRLYALVQNVTEDSGGSSPSRKPDCPDKNL